MQWYYAEQGQQKGPVEDTALSDLVNSGVVKDDTLVWYEGLANWQAYGSVRGMTRGGRSATARKPNRDSPRHQRTSHTTMRLPNRAFAMPASGFASSPA